MLHNYWFKQHNLAGTYVPLAVKPEDIEAALRGLPALGFSGVNLTIPHKQTSMPLMAEIDAVGRGIGAINLVVVRPDGSLVGTNTDAYGCIAQHPSDAAGVAARRRTGGDHGRGRRVAHRDLGAGGRAACGKSASPTARTSAR